jgi:hypothetical protein
MAGWFQSKGEPGPQAQPTESVFEGPRETQETLEFALAQDLLLLSMLIHGTL